MPQWISSFSRKLRSPLEGKGDPWRYNTQSLYFGSCSICRGHRLVVEETSQVEAAYFRAWRLFLGRQCQGCWKKPLGMLFGSLVDSKSWPQHLSACPTTRWCVFLHPLNLGWSCYVFWSTECDRRDTGGVLDLKMPAASTFSFFLHNHHVRSLGSPAGERGHIEQETPKDKRL